MHCLEGAGQKNKRDIKCYRWLKEGKNKMSNAFHLDMSRLEE